jgi:hypothetical protein
MKSYWIWIIIGIIILGIIIWYFMSSSAAATAAATAVATTPPANSPPYAPTPSTNTATTTSIIWNWLPSASATGYLVNTTATTSGATDVGNTTTYTQNGLNSNTAENIFVFAYNTYGDSAPTMLSQSTLTQICPVTKYVDLADLWAQSVQCAILQIPTANWSDVVKANALSYIENPAYTANTVHMQAVSANATKDNTSLQQEIVNDAYANATS